MVVRISNYTLSLGDLEVAPAQVWGAVRLVPLIRHNVRGDLRLAAKKYDENETIVSIDGELMEDGIKYTSYVPHGMVASWSEDGTPLASWGTQMLNKKDGKVFKDVSVRVMGRMVKRLSKNQLRFLPLHLAMEGYLSIHFNGPECVWSEYSRVAISSGLDPRSEYTLPGKMIGKLEEALKVFEIHQGQTGVLLFVGDALASAFIVPHPDDYRKLHHTLIEDFYGEILYYYSLYSKEVPVLTMALPEKKISSTDDIRRSIEGIRKELGLFKKECMANSLFGRDLTVETLYKTGRFSLKRFIPELKLYSDNHIGEFIISDTGSLEYLKTYCLSKQQTKRAYFLQQLASADWNLLVAAQNCGITYEQLVDRIYKSGFDFLLNWEKVKEKIRQIEKMKKK